MLGMLEQGRPKRRSFQLAAGWGDEALGCEGEPAAS